MQASAGSFQSLEEAIKAGSSHCTHAKQSWVLGGSQRHLSSAHHLLNFRLVCPDDLSTGSRASTEAFLGSLVKARKLT